MHQQRLHVIATIVVCAATLTVAGCAAASLPGPDGTGAGSRGTSTSDTSAAPADPPTDGGGGGHTVGDADGRIGTSATIDELAGTPAVANLDADLRRAVVRATEAAAADGVEVRINSGWRSTRYQRTLLDAAVQEHGSLEEARRWVNTPERSTHVLGRAVDVGPVDAAAWMQEHGSDFGLCQTYENESWHFELSTTPGGTCPTMLRDSSEG
ncbi:M15 family metallopeptidase [Curtobacterium pusillum]|uniref:M15 family metallopeptidase n=1 Tax=Curtobacterium pusillum TaxID=69373 RepID=UPI00119DE474|nr:M15 family metallopeptidase [Curtobacterium pusillum]